MRKRSVGINVRVTVTEKKKVTMLARKCGLSLSEYLRQRAVAYLLYISLNMSSISSLVRVLGDICCRNVVRTSMICIGFGYRSKFS